jgi:predicted phosphodiesterase
VKLVYTTDEHITTNPPVCRTDDWVATMIRVLAWLRELCEKLNATHITGGDITDKDVYTSTNYLLDTVNFLNAHYPNTVGIAGNHGLRYQQLRFLEKSIISTLISSGRLFLLREPYEIDKDVWLHGYNYGEDLIHPDMGVYPEDSKHIMIYHGYVTNDVKDKIGGWFSEDLMYEFPEFDMFLTGDNHTPFVVEKDGQTLINGGSLFRTTIKQIDYKPHVWVIDTEDLSYEAVPVPIEEGVISAAHKDVVEEKKAVMDSVVNTVMENDGVSVSYEDEIDKLVSENKDTIDEDVMVFIAKAMEENE